MKKSFSKIGLISKIELIENTCQAVESVIRVFLQNDCLIFTTPEIKCALEKRRCSRINLIKSCDLNEIKKHIDLGVACGGDGTLMHLARALINTQVPIIGINYGQFGFLMDIKSDEIETQVKDILNRNYFIESRLTLGVRAKSLGPLKQVAINDILIHRGVHGRLTEFLISVDGHSLPAIRSDGIIVASPTGSTGYTLSAHGSLVHPSLNAIVVTPICSHDISITSRSLVLPGESIIQISAPRNDVSIQTDGKPYISIESGEQIEIIGEKKGMTMIHPQSYNYFTRLIERFSKKQRE